MGDSDLEAAATAFQQFRICASSSSRPYTPREWKRSLSIVKEEMSLIALFCGATKDVLLARRVDGSMSLEIRCGVLLEESSESRRE